MKIDKLAWTMVVAGAVLVSASAAFATEIAARTQTSATSPAQFASIGKDQGVKKTLLKIDIRSGCTSKGVVFKIVNRGKKWPRTARLKLFNVDDNTLISERRLRLASLQQVSFIVSDKVNQGRRIGVWVEPDWYERPFAFDAERDCKAK